MSGFAHDAGAVPLADYVREVWTTRDGLPHNSVNAITQTPEGYLWLATWEGAARFNGRGFRNFGIGDATGLPDAGLRALHRGRDGSLLMGGSRGGLTRQLKGDWMPLPSAESLVVEIFEDTMGRVWVGTEGEGLLLIQADGARRVFTRDDGLPGDSVYAVVEDADGTIWIGTSEGLARFDNDRVVAESARLGLPDGPVAALALDSSGELVVATENGAWIGQPDQDRLRPVHEALAGISVARLLVDRDGSIWFGTVDRGAYRVGPLGLEHIGVEDGLPNSRVLALFEDRERNIWIGTNAGLVRLSQAPFSSITQRRGLAGDFVRAVMEHRDGSLWVGSSSGLSRIEGDRVETVGGGSLLDARSVLSLAPGDADDVWVGTYSAGAVRWRDGRVVQQLTREEGLASSEVRAILRGRDGTLWFGTTAGLTRLGSDGMRTITERDGLPDDYVSALHEDQAGRLWVGTGTGTGIVEGSHVRALDPGSVSDAQYTFGFHEEPDGSAMWLATDRGLLRHRTSDGRLAAIGIEHGLPLQKPFAILADRSGNFWLTGNRGVARIAASDATAVANGARARLQSHDLFDEADGMASAQCNGGSSPPATLRADGSVWIATAKGVARVHPERLGTARRFRPPTVIESVIADGRSLQMAPMVTIAAGSRRVELHYAGLSYLMPERMRYRHRLEGFDPDWHEAGNLGQATYTNLPPGDYVFRAEAANPNGEWGDSDATLSFRIEPLLWQRAAFWLVVLLAALGALILAINRRTRRLRRSEQQLRSLVDERTSALTEQTQRLLDADREKSALLHELKLQSERFERQAREDALTGLSNRRAFDELVVREFARSRRTGTVLCLGLLDIDHFKRINDECSHQVGDLALKSVAAAIRASCRDIDYVARFGGEEFAILLPHTEIDDARRVFERLRGAIQRLAFEGLAPGLHLTVSIGVAANTDLPDAHALIAAADAALYQAKQSGRNRVCG